MKIIDGIKGLLGKPTIETKSNVGGKISSWLTSFGSGGPMDASLLNDDQLLKAYNNIPELQIVIGTLAKLCSLANPLVQKGDELLTEHPAIDLLNNPNPLQNRTELVQQYITFFSIFGNSYQYSNRPSLNPLPDFFWNINPSSVKVNITNELYRATDIDEIIRNYTVTYNSKTEMFSTEEILMKNEPSISLDGNEVEGVSKLFSLKYPLSNIEGAYKSRNIFIYKRGAIGLLSPEPSRPDEYNSDLPDSEAIEKIQKEYQNTYGPLNNGHAIAVGSHPMKWTPIVMPVKDLMLFEEIDSDFAKIIDSYGLNQNIFSSTKAATFENVKQGLISAIQNTAQVIMTDWFNSLSNEWGLEEKGEMLVADFSHVHIMQEDEEKAAKIRETDARAYQTLINSGFSEEEAKNFIKLA